MADDSHEGSPKNELSRVESNEDAETRAARRELKQSSISDPPISTSEHAPTSTSTDEKATRPDSPSDEVIEENNSERLRTDVVSPKKKRAHDQLDAGKDAEDNDAQSIVSTDSTKDRASRLEPEKKRVRDEDSKGDDSYASGEPMDETGKTPVKKSPETTRTATTTTSTAATTTLSAFAASGFAKLATESSPFGSFGDSKPSIFATGNSSSSTPSPFGTLSSTNTASNPVAAPAAPKLSFGSAASASPFASLSTANGGSIGGSAFGSPFGNAFSDKKAAQPFGLSSGKPLQNSKPAKPFGAPESDNEEEADDEDGDEGAEQFEADRPFSPDKEFDEKEKKKPKLQRVEIDDGESGEVAIVSVRAKMFHHDKEAGWKERGTGMLKINAPVNCVEFDDADVPIPGSFDASGLELSDEDDSTTGRKVVRLIMRQDHTHRIILNTIVMPAMAFQEKASLKSVGILFTAFEGEDAKPVNVTMKMSAANAKVFMTQINAIQKELRAN